MSAARGIREPIQEASVSVMEILGKGSTTLPWHLVASSCREAMAGEDQAVVKPTTMEPREAARAAPSSAMGRREEVMVAGMGAAYWLPVHPFLSTPHG